MAGRIRTIKPELREHLPFASLTDRAARLFLMLYTLVDDEGRCPGSAAFLSGAVFFARACAANVIGQVISELEAADLVRAYSVNGAPFLEIVGWHVQRAVTYQRIEKPQAGRYPAPASNHSGNDSRTTSGTDSGTDLRSPISDPRRGFGEREREAREASPLPLPAGWQPPAGGKTESAIAKLRATNPQRAETVLQHFANHVASKGITSRDWDAEGASFVLRAIEFSGRSPRRAPNVGRAEPAADDDEYSAGIDANGRLIL